MRLKNIIIVLLIPFSLIVATAFISDNDKLSHDIEENKPVTYGEVLEVEGLNDSINYNFMNMERLYSERWDTLAQPTFWRTLMKLSDDSAVINIAKSRTIINKIAVKDWDKLSDNQKNSIRDSVRTVYDLEDDAKVFMTSGKQSFYDFEKVIPSIGKGIEIFEENGVDPFYAQAILLIESPNKIQKSPVGAYGSFQLMRNVAINMGLKVNKYVDERKDFDKSAMAASKLIKTICIPELNKILEANNIKYESKDTWYRLLVLHVYHAGAGNVKLAINKIAPKEGNIALIQKLWQTEVGGFRNASQNYSQLALASMFELDNIIYRNCENILPKN